MFTKKQFWNNSEMRDKAKLILSITSSYVTGAIIAALIYQHVQFKLFYLVCMFLLAYDLYTLKILRYFGQFKP